VSEPGRPRPGPRPRPFDAGTAAKTALGFAVAVLLVYLLGAVVGWERTVAGLRTADPAVVAAACLSSLLCLAAWGKTWQVVLRAVDVAVPYRRLVVTFYAATFANYVTPMGQAGGEPFIAYVLARDVGTDYERSLASVVVADLLRLAAFLSVGLVGVVYLLAAAGPLPGGVDRFVGLLVGTAVLVPVIAVIGWRRRERVARAVLRTFAPVARRTDRVDLGAVRARIDRFYGAVERVADAPRAVAVASGFAYAGWLLFALPLYLAGVALGQPVPLGLVCFLVPVTVVVGAAPTPGGLGAIEGSLVVLLGALAALPAGDALAVVTLYRLASYWLVIALGGIAALWVLARS